MSETNKFSDIFRQMAERIERNAEAEFGGAVVIVPLVGEPVSMVLFGPKGDTTAFWALIRSKVEIATNEHLENEQKKPGAWAQPPRR